MTRFTQPYLTNRSMLSRAVSSCVNERQAMAVAAMSKNPSSPGSLWNTPFFGARQIESRLPTP